jgi:hypothetical protein
MAHRSTPVSQLVMEVQSPIVAERVTLHVTARFAKRPSAAASALGVTVFNWKTVTLPWEDVTDVVLTSVTRFTRRGWVPGIVQRDGDVLPVAFAEFLPSDGHATGPAPEMSTSGGGGRSLSTDPRGVGCTQSGAGQTAGTVPDQAANGAKAG